MGKRNRLLSYGRLSHLWGAETMLSRMKGYGRVYSWEGRSKQTPSYPSSFKLCEFKVTIKIFT